eukprot:1146633-Pelagomonas_calceolata.AAC.1
MSPERHSVILPESKLFHGLHQVSCCLSSPPVPCLAPVCKFWLITKVELSVNDDLSCLVGCGPSEGAI